MTKKMKWALFAIALLVVAIAGRLMGESAGEKGLTRLQVIWPDFMSMPETDRALLGGLALSCDLHKFEPQRDAVLSCLRRAAEDPDALVPKGVSKGDAPAKLEALIPRA